MLVYTRPLAHNKDSEEDAPLEDDQMNVNEEQKSKELFRAVSSGNVGAVQALIQIGLKRGLVQQRRRLSFPSVAVTFKPFVTLLKQSASVDVQDARGAVPVHIGMSQDPGCPSRSTPGGPSLHNSRSASCAAGFMGHKDSACALITTETKKKHTQWTKLPLGSSSW